MNEHDLIARYFAPLAAEGALGLRDDAAWLPPLPQDGTLVISTDTLISTIHFFADDPPAYIAQKALRVNLSDLAAKGAIPIGFCLNFAAPPGLSEEWLSSFVEGLGADMNDYQILLLGGDTVMTPGPLTLSITIIGRIVPPDRFIPRLGAEPGDHLYVTGTIGDSALGLYTHPSRQSSENHSLNPCDVHSILSQEDRHYLYHRYLLPEPRLDACRLLQKYARTAMDISDGLIGELGKMLIPSGLSAEIYIPKIPFSAAARRLFGFSPEAQTRALTGGDDYELLISIPPEQSVFFEKDAQREGVQTTYIGLVTKNASPAILALDSSGVPLLFPRPAYEHNI